MKKLLLSLSLIAAAPICANGFVEATKNFYSNVSYSAKAYGKQIANLYTNNFDEKSMAAGAVTGVIFGSGKRVTSKRGILANIWSKNPKIRCGLFGAGIGACTTIAFKLMDKAYQQYKNS